MGTDTGGGDAGGVVEGGVCPKTVEAAHRVIAAKEGNPLVRTRTSIPATQKAGSSVIGESLRIAVPNKHPPKGRVSLLCRRNPPAQPIACALQPHAGANLRFQQKLLHRNQWINQRAPSFARCPVLHALNQHRAIAASS